MSIIFHSKKNGKRNEGKYIWLTAGFREKIDRKIGIHYIKWYKNDGSYLYISVWFNSTLLSFQLKQSMTLFKGCLYY